MLDRVKFITDLSKAAQELKQPSEKIISHGAILYDLILNFLEANTLEQALLAMTRLGEYLAEHIEATPLFARMSITIKLSPKQIQLLQQLTVLQQQLKQKKFQPQSIADQVYINFIQGLGHFHHLIGEQPLLQEYQEPKHKEYKENRDFSKIVVATPERLNLQTKIVSPIEELFYKILSAKDIFVMTLALSELGEFLKHELLTKTDRNVIKKINHIATKIIKQRGHFHGLTEMVVHNLAIIRQGSEQLYQESVAEKKYSEMQADPYYNDVIQYGIQCFSALSESNKKFKKLTNPISKSSLTQVKVFIAKQLIPASDDRLTIAHQIKLKKQFHHEQGAIDSLEDLSSSFTSYVCTASEAKELSSAKKSKFTAELLEVIQKKLALIQVDHLSFSFLRKLKRTQVHALFKTLENIENNKESTLTELFKIKKIDITQLLSNSSLVQFFQDFIELEKFINIYYIYITGEEKLSEEGRAEIIAELFSVEQAQAIFKKTTLLDESIGAILKLGIYGNLLVSLQLTFKAKLEHHTSLQTSLNQARLAYFRKFLIFAEKDINEMSIEEREELYKKFKTLIKDIKVILSYQKIVHAILKTPDSPLFTFPWEKNCDFIVTLLKKSIDEKRKLTVEEYKNFTEAYTYLPKPTFIALRRQETLEELKAMPPESKLTGEDQQQLADMHSIAKVFYSAELFNKPQLDAKSVETSEQHHLFELFSAVVNAKNIKELADAIYELGLLDQDQDEMTLDLGNLTNLSLDVEIFIKQLRYGLNEQDEHSRLVNVLDNGLSLFESLIHAPKQIKFTRKLTQVAFLTDIQSWFQAKLILIETNTSSSSGSDEETDSKAYTPPRSPASMVSYLTARPESPFIPTPTASPIHSSQMSARTLTDSKVSTSQLSVTSRKDRSNSLSQLSTASHKDRRGSSPQLSIVSRKDSKESAAQASDEAKYQVQAPTARPPLPNKQPGLFARAWLYIKNNPIKVSLFMLLSILLIGLLVFSGGTAVAAAGGAVGLAALKAGIGVLFSSYGISGTLLGGVILGAGSSLWQEEDRQIEPYSISVSRTLPYEQQHHKRPLSRSHSYTYGMREFINLKEKPVVHEQVILDTANRITFPLQKKIPQPTQQIKTEDIPGIKRLSRSLSS